MLCTQGVSKRKEREWSIAQSIYNDVIMQIASKVAKHPEGLTN